MKKESDYREITPSKQLKVFVHSYWMYHNQLDKEKEIALLPDSFFKVFCVVKNEKIIKYQLTGLWTNQTKYTVPAFSYVYGCRLKVLAPEFLLNQKIAGLVDAFQDLDPSFLNFDKANLSSFDSIVKHWDSELIKTKKGNIIDKRKLALSDLIYSKKGNVSISEIAKHTVWSSRQINRYFNNYLGISLKKYLSIQKCYAACLKIKASKSFPETDYFDQSHFIREVKKHTSETPKSLFQQQKDRFVQLFYVKGI